MYSDDGAEILTDGFSLLDKVLWEERNGKCPVLAFCRKIWRALPCWRSL